MTRRNVKRVDYKNIKPINVIDSSSDESGNESDDDFVSSLTPPTKKKKTTKTTTKKKNDSAITKKNQKTDTLQLEPRKRKTRTSNVESCFEQDLITAIEISQGETVNNCAKYDDNEDDFDSSSPNIKNTHNKRRAAGNREKDCKENLPVDINPAAAISDDSITDSDKANSLSEEDSAKLSSASKEIALPPSKEGSLSSKSTTPSVTKTMPLTPKVLQNKCVTSKVLTPDICTTSLTKSKAMTPSLPTSSVINTKVITPGRLRLGLSRNIRIAKPLHSNVTI